MQRIFGGSSIRAYFPHVCKVEHEAHHQSVRIIPMKIWRGSLAKSPKIIMGANFLIQALQFAIVILRKIVCGDLVDPFGSAIMQLRVE